MLYTYVHLHAMLYGQWNEQLIMEANEPVDVACCGVDYQEALRLFEMKSQVFSTFLSCFNPLRKIVIKKLWTKI